jgi:hypothetical protein
LVTSSIAIVGWASLTILPLPWPSAIVAPVGLDRLTPSPQQERGCDDAAQ